MESKKWYYSKTIWINLISVGTVFAARRYGLEFSAEETGAVLVMVNLILRSVTNKGLEA